MCTENVRYYETLVDRVLITPDGKPFRYVVSGERVPLCDCPPMQQKTIDGTILPLYVLTIECMKTSDATATVQRTTSREMADAAARAGGSVIWRDDRCDYYITLRRIERGKSYKRQHIYEYANGLIKIHMDKYYVPPPHTSIDDIPAVIEE